MVSANHLLTDEEALRSQFDRDGYLFFEKIIDQELIHALRNDITQVLSDCGWIDSSRPMDAVPIGFPYRENEPEFELSCAGSENSRVSTPSNTSRPCKDCSRRCWANRRSRIR